MATLSENEWRDLELEDRCEFLVDGVRHTGTIVRIGNTRTWGQIRSDQDGQRYDFQSGEHGFYRI